MYRVTKSKTVQDALKDQQTFSEHTFLVGENVKVDVTLNGVKAVEGLQLDVTQEDIDALPPGHIFKAMVKVSMVPVVDRG